MVLLALQGKVSKLLMMLATVCSTWVSVNAGTSRRSVLTPSGLACFTSVRRANKQVSRMGTTNIVQRTWSCFKFTWESFPSIGFVLVFHLARTCLLILLIVCMDSVFLLEQPSTSLMVLFHRMRQTFRLLKAVGVKVGFVQKEKLKHVQCYNRVIE